MTENRLVIILGALFCLTATAAVSVGGASTGAWRSMPLTPALVGGAVAWTCWSLTRTRASRALLTTVAFAVCSILFLSAQTAWPSITAELTTAAWIVVGAFVAFCWWHQHRQNPGSSVPEHIVYFVLASAVSWRWENFRVVGGRTLDPDAETVLAISRAMSSLYDTDVREPMWVWAAHVLNGLVGAPEPAIRLFSLCSSIALLVAAWIFVRSQLAAPVITAGAVFLLSRHPYLIDSSSRGLRTEFYVAAVLVFAFAVFNRELSKRARSVLLGAAVAILALTQLNSLVFTLPLALWGCWKHKLHWATGVVVTTLAIAAVTPHLLNNARTNGDPFWSLNSHATFYRNQEFVKVRQTGCDGCPAPEALAENSYAGARSTTTRYVFGMHSFGEVVLRIGQGMRMVFVSRGAPTIVLLGSSSLLALFVYALGLLCLVASRSSVVLVPVVAINLLFFIVPVGLDERLLMVAAPLFAVAATVGLFVLVNLSRGQKFRVVIGSLVR